MELGYAIQTLKNQLADEFNDLSLAVQNKDKDIEERQKERLQQLQDAMNILGMINR